MIDHPQKASPFEKLYKRQLSENDVAEIRSNLVGLFDVLIEIERDRKESESHATDHH